MSATVPVLPLSPLNLTPALSIRGEVLSSPMPEAVTCAGEHHTLKNAAMMQTASVVGGTGNY